MVVGGELLCAASSALIVSGDICVNPFPPVAGLGFAEAAELLDTSNGLIEFWLKPVVCGDDDFEEVSDCRASIADDRAPRASNMAELRQMPRRAASTS